MDYAEGNAKKYVSNRGGKLSAVETLTLFGHSFVA